MMRTKVETNRKRLDIKLRFGSSWATGLFIILVFILVPGFRTPGNVSNLLLRSVPLLLVSIGQTFVLLGAAIDLSVGSIFALSTAIASSFMKYGIVLGATLAVIAGMCAGLANGLVVTRFKINPFLVTLSMNIVIGGICLFIRPYPGGEIPIEFINFISFKVGPVPSTALFLFASIILVSVFVLRRTVFSRHLYAVGGNAEAARLAGINADRVMVIAYVLSGLFASLGGLFMAARMGCGDPSVGVPYQMESITAAVLGGTALTGGKGGPVGTLFGVVLVVTLGNIFNLLNFNNYWQQISRGLILLAVVGISEFQFARKEEFRLKKSVK
jgi:ribose/xylose/arabinose/galactoside ABC-type transport system permease subunit